MGVQAIQCSACGGTVAMVAGEDMPRCVFCGSDALVEEKSEAIEQPDDHLAFEVDEGGARTIFKKFAKSSWFHPKELRQAVLNLKAVLVPAWVYSGTIESHWMALVPGPTRSGKRPMTGDEKIDVKEILILSGSKLTQTELNALYPFKLGDQKPFDPEESKLPFEVSRLTRSLARKQAKHTMLELHKSRIDAAINAKKVSMSCLYDNLEGAPILLPVYLCSYRYKDTAYRLVINGQTGEWCGKGPKSLAKILLVAGIGLAAIAGLLYYAQ